MTAKIIGMAHVHDVQKQVFDDDGPMMVPDLDFELRADFSDGPFAHLWTEGDSYIKTMWRKNSKPARNAEVAEAHRHDGQLWERLIEFAEAQPICVYVGWLVYDTGIRDSQGPPQDALEPLFHLSPEYLAGTEAAFIKENQ